MTKRLGMLVICVLAAFIAGMLSSIAVEVADNSSLLTQPLFLWSVAQSAVIFYAAVPLAILALMSANRRTPSIWVALLVPVAWLSIMFLWWAYKPWVHYGEFPWSGFRRHYIGMLPVALTVGAAFTLCARLLLNPEIGRTSEGKK